MGKTERKDGLGEILKEAVKEAEKQFMRHQLFGPRIPEYKPKKRKK
jgi:hypothetical protein